MVDPPPAVRPPAPHRLLPERIGDGPSPVPGSGAGGPRVWPPPWAKAAPALRLPWLLATVAVCVTGVVLAQVGHVASARPLLLVTAPLLPVLCVAGSYGGTGDPFAEVTRTTPAGGLRVLLLRTGHVLVLGMPLLTGMALLLPDDGRPPFASAGWLLPCLTLTLATLFLSSYVGNWTASLLVSCSWVLVLSLLTKPPADSDKQHPSGHLAHRLAEASEKLVGVAESLAWGAAATVLAELLVLRRHVFDRPGSR
ncbi:zf-HC2 domain-containing protein [Streptomyces sp. NPDC002276]